MSEQDWKYWPLVLYFILHIRRQNLFLSSADWGGLQRQIPPKKETHLLCRELTFRSCYDQASLLGEL